MSDQQAEDALTEIDEIDEIDEKPVKAAKSRKKAPAADLGLNPATIRARAIVLGRLKG